MLDILSWNFIGNKTFFDKIHTVQNKKGSPYKLCKKYKPPWRKLFPYDVELSIEVTRRSFQTHNS